MEEQNQQEPVKKEEGKAFNTLMAIFTILGIFFLLFIDMAVNVPWAPAERINLNLYVIPIFVAISVMLTRYVNKHRI